MAHSLTRVTMTQEELEERRMEAAKLFRRRVSQATIAERLGVSKVAVHYWYKDWKAGGKNALRRKKMGPEAHLSAKDLKKIDRVLRKGPQSAGYATDLWTLERIKAVIANETGVRFGMTHVWRILRRLGWSVQRPERRSRERDEVAIERWKKVEWPSIKKRGFAKA